MEKLKNLACPKCGCRNFELTEIIETTTKMDFSTKRCRNVNDIPYSSFKENDIKRTFMLKCKKCGYTLKRIEKEHVKLNKYAIDEIQYDIPYVVRKFI